MLYTEEELKRLKKISESLGQGNVTNSKNSSQTKSSSKASSSKKYSSFEEYSGAVIKGSIFDEIADSLNDLYEGFKDLKSDNPDISKAYKDALSCIKIFRTYYILEELYKKYNPADYKVISRKFKLNYPTRESIAYLHYLAVEQYKIDFSQYEKLIEPYVTEDMLYVDEICDYIEDNLTSPVIKSEFKVFATILNGVMNDSCKYSFLLTSTGKQLIKLAKHGNAAKTARAIFDMLTYL